MGDFDLVQLQRKLMPQPGDMVIARCLMGAWGSDAERLPISMWVDKGDIGCVIQSWMEGNSVRMRLLIKNSLVVFSCKLENLRLNWLIES